MSRPIVWFGHRGRDVADLQRILTALDCCHPAPGYEDTEGEFGPQTDEAVRVFQRRNGIEENPVVDAYLWELLDGADRTGTERLRPPAG